MIHGFHLLFFDVSGGEFFLIVLVIFLLFGPKKIPEFARFIGKGMKEVRKATDEIKYEINKQTREINTAKNEIMGEVEKNINETEVYSSKNKEYIYHENPYPEVTQPIEPTGQNNNEDKPLNPVQSDNGTQL